MASVKTYYAQVINATSYEISELEEKPDIQTASACIAVKAFQKIWNLSP